MGYTVIKKLPPPESFIQDYPLSDWACEKISTDRREIKNILSGKDSRLLMIVGPCSAWPSQAVMTFAERLAPLNEQFSDVMKIVMRVYTQKPRTGLAWTGPVNQPNIFSPPDIESGIRTVRRLMVDIIEMGLPIADESLFTHNSRAIIELLSWVAIGARSSEDQEHRIFASSIDSPVGLKNPTHGSLEVATNSVKVAQHGHVAVMDGHEVLTEGNPFAHLVLRGSHGHPNYANQFLEQAYQIMQEKNIKNPAILIDASHDNCRVKGLKDFKRQPEIIHEVLDAIHAVPHLSKLVKGFMLESYIKEGNQLVDKSHPEHLDWDGLSITDPCLSWESTEKHLHTLAQRLRT